MNWTPIEHSMPSAVPFFIMAGFVLYFLVWAFEKDWFRADWLPDIKGWRRWLALLAIIAATISGADKAPPVMQSLFRLLFWDARVRWALSQTYEHNVEAAEAVEATEELTEEIEEVATNEVVHISFDWHAQDRQPYHSRQNVLAWTTQVVPQEIDGVLYDDHYIEFSAGVSTNPAVIEVEYATTMANGEIYREFANVTTSSYPHTEIVDLQSGSHTCYWFRCRVPQFATSSLRDWSGEALFGSPSQDSGFDLVGLLQVDQDGNIYEGRGGSFVIGGTPCTFTNGILTEVTQ